MCEKCKDTGYLIWQEERNGKLYDFGRTCDCYKIRKAAERMEQARQDSNIVGVMWNMRLDTYDGNRGIYEKRIKELAELNLKQPYVWWYIGGRTGTGKTHICTAICSELLRAKREVYYMKWREEARELKSLVNDNYKYSKRLKKLQKVDILYIDDFLQGGVTEADINLAFSIINERYLYSRKTLFSSELNLAQLAEKSSAIAGRIKEKSDRYVMNVQGMPDGRLN